MGLRPMLLDPWENRMTKQQRKFIAELEGKTGTRFSRIELTGSNHLRLYLNTGRFVITGGTPSDRRAFANCAAQIRRMLAESPAK